MLLSFIAIFIFEEIRDEALSKLSSTHSKEIASLESTKNVLLTELSRSSLARCHEVSECGKQVKEDVSSSNKHHNFYNTHFN